MSLRLLILSDLHLEFGPFVPPDPALYDLVVLAGDVHGDGVKAVHWAQRESTFARKPVLLVPGMLADVTREALRIMAGMFWDLGEEGRQVLSARARRGTRPS